MIPYGKQNITEDDVNAVVKVLKSDFLTQGDQVPSFEQAIANYCGVQYACAVNSATSALHIACLALGVNETDVVWTSPISFVASANCALYCGATIDFVDIEVSSANICPVKLKEKLEVAKKDNCIPKAIVVVHMAGTSCDMAEISRITNQYNVKIIEDASHAVGAKYREKPVGNCQFSDITVFSFHPVKIITTAEGGIALTNNKDIAEKLALYRSHGVTKELTAFKNPNSHPWVYEQHTLGYNYRMTEIQAALGLSQLTRLDEFVAKRHQLATRYRQALSHLPLSFQHINDDTYSSFHLFLIQLTTDAAINRDKLFTKLRESGIGVNVHYIPIHTQPYYQTLGFELGDFPNAENYYQHCLSLPLYPDLLDKDFDHIVSTLEEYLTLP